MHSLDMPMQISLLRERLLTFDVSADKTFPKVGRLEVLAHVISAHKHLATGFLVAGHILGFLDTLSRRNLPLAALGNMGFVVFFR